MTFYNKLYRQISTPEDIPRLSEKYTLPEDMLLVIYTQKTIRDTIQRFYRIKARSAGMYRQWKRGEPLLSLARSNYFSPVLTAKLILSHHGLGKKVYNSYVRDRSQIEDPRLRREMEEVVENDIIYSEKGNRIQRERGVMAEAEISSWLNDMGAEYYRENDLRKMGKEKTPDFKLKQPLIYKGQELEWVESKASYGDKWKLKEDMRNQLKPYRKIYGPGMVIYWYGFTIPHREEKDIIVGNRSVLIDYANIWVKKEEGAPAVGAGTGNH